MGIEIFIQDFRCLLVEIPSLPPAWEKGSRGVTTEFKPNPHPQGEKGALGEDMVPVAIPRGWLPQPSHTHL